MESYEAPQSAKRTPGAPVLLVYSEDKGPIS